MVVLADKSFLGPIEERSWVKRAWEIMSNYILSYLHYNLGFLIRHECDRSGKFIKLERSRRGKVCEMCGTRHRMYILPCKRCHMLACEGYPRHRL